MRISGRRLSEHLRLCLPYIGIVSTVWAMRLLADALGAPLAAVQAISVTLSVGICLILLVVQIHLRRFGGYGSVFLFSLILNAWAQILICSSVAFAWLTGTSNIYTHARFLMSKTDLPMHIYGQLTFALGYLTLVAAAAACLILFLLRLPFGTAIGKLAYRMIARYRYRWFGAVDEQKRPRT